MRQILLSFLATPERRAVANNLGWLIAEKFVRLALSVVIGFVVARYLGPVEFGSLSYVLAVVAIGASIAEGGVSAVVRREIAAESARAAAWFRAAWALRLGAGVLCYIAVLGWAVWGTADAQERTLFAIVGLLLFQPALAVSDLWLQGRLQARWSTTAQVLALVVGSVLRLLLVWARAPLWCFAAVAVVEAGIVILLLNAFARRLRGGALTEPDDGLRAATAQLWTESWPLLVSGLTVMIYIRIDLIMVRQMVGESAAGAYAAAVRLSEIWFFLPAAIVSSFLPSLLRARTAGGAAYDRALQRLLDLNAGCAYALAVPTVLLAPWLIRLAYGPQYAASVPILMVHGWTLIWAGLGVVRGQYCVNEGLVRWHLGATATGAALNVVLNVVLIRRYGAVGAAWATFAAQATAAWVTSFCFAPTRDVAGLQTRALLIPFRCFRYVRVRN